METINTNNPSWFKHWFNSSFYHQLYAHRNEKEAVDFIDALLHALQPLPNSCMMDLGCGAGRHAKYLATKGFRVTGTDLAFSSIKTAKKYETENLHFFQHDMRRPFGVAAFDYVFNFFTSFGYFKTAEENHQVINNISRSLKPGGILIMDYLNVHYAEQRLVPSEEKEIDGIIYNISRWADEWHIFKKIVIRNIQASGPYEFIEQVEKIYLHNFVHLFERNGLSLQHVYGDYALNRYDVTTSPRMVMVAVKN